MQRDRQDTNICQNASPGLLGAVCVSLLAGITSAPALADTLIAQVNNCPQVFYEEPFNSSVAAPQGCPPNAASSQVPPIPTPSVPILPAPASGDPTSYPPTPEQLGEPAATVTPVNGVVTVRLINATGTVINYQVIEDTELRPLAGESAVTLQGLSAPVTLTFYREDGGLLAVTPVAIAEPGVLEVTLDETADLGVDQTTLVIQETGSVFLN